MKHICIAYIQCMFVLFVLFPLGSITKESTTKLVAKVHINQIVC